MLRVLPAPSHTCKHVLPGGGLFVDGLQPHETDQTTHTVTACMEPISRQVGRNLAAAEERTFCENPVDFIHQFQRLSIHADRRIIQ
ncbi:MAG: hypothetical protein ACI9LZ_003531 [Glaciecola sp.]|jgi:hypothetical protein